jgi:hypothetical protein
MIRIGKLMVIALALCYAQLGWAASKSLIELSKSKKKVKDGEYEFVLDTSQEVKKGTKISPELVKSSLESKLGTTYGVKVTAKGADTVSVTYTTDEAKFLEQVGKTKIRASGDVELALESSVSDGGIRASKLDRKAAADEVKGIVLKADKSAITVKVTESNNAKVKNGASIKVKADKAVKVKDNVFFIPEKEEGGAWVPKAGSFQAPSK